ncbi:MAG TPA: elongation factor G [Bacillota bacterium]|nr:elongation factor G [Bacillota bacterium]
MKAYTSDNIRNIAIIGHGSTGKTTFLEACLLATGVISRLGQVEAGNTVSDFDKMEIEKKYSINATMVPVEYNKVKLNFIDTPGFFDFVGEVNSALRAAEVAAIFVDASSGIQVGTEKAWASCNQFGVPRFFVLNKTDKDNVDVDAVVASLKSKFGTSVATPDDREALSEAIAETDEELMEKYFENGGFSDEEFAKGLLQGIASCDIAPVFTCSALQGTGIKELLDAFIKYTPKPTHHAVYETVDGEEVICGDGAPAAFVFKTIADPFLGKISLAKVIRGTLTPGMNIFNPRSGKDEKLGSMFFMRGKTQGECPSASYGDIVALGKLQLTQTGDTLCDKAAQVEFPPVDFPQPTLFMAIEPAKRGEEDKLTTGLRRLMEEDPSFVLERNAETRQSLLGGQGDIQLGIVIAKLKDRYNTEIVTVPLKVAYRETIKGESAVQGRHKKQSGGAGQYGDVWIRFSPSEEEFEFGEDLFGGSVPKQYVPAVEKGLRECMEKGPLAGCKCQNIKAILYDGSYHDVDSNEISFKIAASLAFKKGIVEAKPCLLEPIMRIEVLVPEDYTGDVMGDINKRRGRILGMEPQHGGITKLMAEVPQAELSDYAIVLRAMTQARASFTMDFERYDEVPGNLAQKIIEAYKEEEEAENK